MYDMVEIRGTLTVADYACFQYFHRLRRARLFLAFLLCILGAALALMTAARDPNLAANLRPLLISFAVYLLLLIVIPYVSARRQFARQAYLHEPFTQEFTPEVIRSSCSSVSSEVKWKIVCDVRETHRLFLLYYAPNIALIVPKRVFEDDAQMAAWRHFTESRISPQKINKPGFIGRWC
jgi:hypothetical protein